MIKDYILVGIVTFGIFYFPITHYCKGDVVKADTGTKINTLVLDKSKVNIKIEDDFAKYPYSVSLKGQNFIKEHESLSFVRYTNKGVKRPSIGWGHQVYEGENIPETITKEYAQKLFNKDIEKVNGGINRLLRPLHERGFKFSQDFVDGLGSLIYNCGETGIRRSDFYQTLLKCQKDENEKSNIRKSCFNFALSKIKTTHVYLGGHKVRRMNEYKLMANI